MSGDSPYLDSLQGAVPGIGGTILSSGAAAATTGFSYMDDIQVDLLIQATQADQRGVVLTAPRLTLMNGQRSFITIAKQISFISGLTLAVFCLIVICLLEVLKRKLYLV